MSIKLTEFERVTLLVAIGDHALVLDEMDNILYKESIKALRRVEKKLRAK